MIQVEALNAAQAEAAVIELEQLQAAAMELARTEAAAIRITGAQGVEAGTINGVYKLQRNEKWPEWKQCDAERHRFNYLHCASNNKWLVSEYSRASCGPAFSKVLGPQSLPTDARKWQVLNDSESWEEQQLKARLDQLSHIHACTLAGMMHAYIQTCSDACSPMHSRTYACGHVRICAHTCVHVYVCMRARFDARMHAFMY